MTRRLGWYVHHHGRGHVTRLLALAPALDADIRCFSSLAPPEGLPDNCSWTMLDRDDDAADAASDPSHADPTVSGLLHWAPLGHTGHRHRLATIAAALDASPVDAFVVDVSAEVALFVRLLGVRTVIVAQPGVRDDEAHRVTYRSATRILAPWPRALLAPEHLDAVRSRTVYTGGISRFESRRAAPVALADARSDGVATARSGIVLIGGRGGSDIAAGDITAAAAASGQTWKILGATPEATWSADPWTDLTSARVVISWAGQNAIADLAAAGSSAIVIPQKRPFSEQYETAAALQRAGLAVVAPSWPDASAWPDLIERALLLEPDWAPWEVDGAIARGADVIASTAGGRP